MGNQVAYPGVGGGDFSEPLSRSTEVPYDGVCSCFGSGSISLSVQIDKDTYEIGEQIVVSAQVNNQSNKRIRAIQVNLQRDFYNNFQHIRHTVIGIRDCNIQATGSFSWTNHLQVPGTPPSMDTVLNKTSYFLKVIVIVAFAKNVCIQLPVNIFLGLKSVEMMNPYAAHAMGPMMQACTANLPPGMTQPCTAGPLGP